MTRKTPATEAKNIFGHPAEIERLAMQVFSKTSIGNRRIIKIFGRKILSYTNSKSRDREILSKTDALIRKIENESILTARSLLHLWRTSPPASMKDAEFKVFSQWGEDGIIQWIIRKIPGVSETFVEFGVSDYDESNTRFLLMNDNWSGLIIDSSAALVRKIRENAYAWRHALTPIEAFIDRDNM